MASLKLLVTANATSTGGRNGHTQSDDGIVSIDLSIPKEMGGPGKPGTTTPEHLFAAGYAACFGSAAEFTARQLKLNVQRIEIKAAVSIGQRLDGAFGLKVDLVANISGLAQPDAEKLIRAADKVCPYSNAVRGNVDVGITVNAM
jgi:lipoyl-dependent peroxiredoxin